MLALTILMVILCRRILRKSSLILEKSKFGFNNSRSDGRPQGFLGSGVGNTGYRLYVGTPTNSAKYFSGILGAVLTKTITNLPTDRSQVVVYLYGQVLSQWVVLIWRSWVAQGA